MPIITNLLTMLLTFPLVVFLILSFLFMLWRKKSDQAIKLAADLTLPLFFGAISFLWFELWSGTSYTFFILILALIATAFTVSYWKLHADIHTVKLMKSLWRLLFVVLMPLYLVLFGTGIFMSIFTYFA